MKCELELSLVTEKSSMELAGHLHAPQKSNGLVNLHAILSRICLSLITCNLNRDGSSGNLNQ